MRYPDAEKFKGMILWAGGTDGPEATPGNYYARLISEKDTLTVPFETIKDPRSSATQEDLQKQFDFLISVRDKLSETNEAIKQIKNIRSQMKEVLTKIKGQNGADEIKKSEKSIDKKITEIEEALYQTKNRSSQDPLNFPIRLNDKLAGVGSLMSIGDFKPTDQAIEVKNYLTKLIDEQLSKLKEVIDKDIPAFNKLVHDYSIPSVILKKDKGS